MTRTADYHYRRKRAALMQPGVLCVVCGQPINLSIKDPYDPMSFQADHLTPIASGGDNRGELVPTHRKCNLAKGVRDLELVRVDPHSRRHY